MAKEGKGKREGKKGRRKVDWVNVGEQVTELREESWRTYWAEMDGAEAIEFLREPKDHLVKQGLIEEDYRVQTFIVNADVKSVAGPVVCNVLMVFPEERFATITIYRHPHD